MDLLPTLRSISRSPAYALTCIAVIALAVGANAAIFSLVYSVILAPLPYPDAERLMFVWEKFPNMPDPLGSRIQVARRNYLEWKRQASSFDGMAAFQEEQLDETGRGQARHVSAASASADFFPLLGVQPQLGRLFVAEDERQASRVVVVSDEYYTAQLHRDGNALGRPVTLARASYTIVGVLPPKFHLPAMWEGMDQKKPEVWVPLSRLWRTAADDSKRQLYVVAKLKAGVPLAQARAEMKGIAERLAKADPALNEGWQVAVFPFRVEDTAPTLHLALYVLLGAVAFLLLIACANLANLTLARMSARSREVAVRLALGATRGRLVRQLMMESLAVSLAGAGAGLVLAHWAVRGMLALEPVDFQRPELIEINLPVFLFTAAASILTALLFGLAPALSASRLDLNSAMKSGGWSSSDGKSRSRQFLVAVEIAMALVLISGAGLMIRSFRAMVETGIGFKTDRLIAVDVDLPETRYPAGESRSRFFRELMAQARAVPGVSGVSVIDNLPLHRLSIINFYIAGRPEPPKSSLPMADYAQASPGYLAMIGMKLLAGRYFTESDLALNEKDGNGVVIVNQAWVRKFMNGEAPLGQRIINSAKKNTFQIIGVVEDYRPMGTENGARPQMFWPYLKLNTASLLVRTQGAPAAMTRSIQAAVASLDKDLPTNKVETMEHHLHYWRSQREFNTLLLSVFAGLALLLALIGVYGVLANLVASRTREIGIRMAMGASRWRIAALILRQSMIPVGMGLVAGLAGSFALTRFIQGLLFEVRAEDSLTRLLATGAILLLSPAAIYLPLRRALRVECTVALRDE
jgi:putative ABC transport system permease protein